MNSETSLQTSGTVAADAYRLGTMVGRHQAFGSVATRATAAQVDCLRQIRDQKLHQNWSASWSEFCKTELGVSDSQMNRMIRCLERFGPSYFALTQLTRVSPKVYEAIAPHISEEGLTLDSETFALSSENTDRIVAAVAELRNRLAESSPARIDGPFELLQKRFEELIGRVENAQSALDAEQQQALGQMMERLLEVVHLPIAA